jgi:peptidoglycan/LPS O-acetylase OafA/YrhL
VIHDQHLGGWYIAGFFFLSGNWVFAALGVPRSVAGPLWSISIEEQFYLTWPRVARRVSRRVLVQIALILLVTGTLCRAILAAYHVDSFTIWFNTFARLDPFAVGALIAVYALHHPLSCGKFARVAFFIAGAACWLLVTKFGYVIYQTPMPFWRAVISYPTITIGSALFLLAAYDAPSVGVTFLRSSVLTYLGKISYGIYVYHGMFLTLMRHVAIQQTIGVFVAALLTIGTASVSYYLLERPFLRLKTRFERVEARPV